METNYYLCIDLKSFYASVECVERGFDPMTTNLVVADPERSDKTICLAVSPSMKALGVKNRCRVFEIPKNIDYIMAVPRMQKYIDYAAKIYSIYLRYFSKDDIYVYSIDECFLDVTHYLKLYGKNAREMALFLMDAISSEVGVRATAGVGTNLYLTKIALDIMAKHAPDFIGELDEESYKRKLWDYRPIKDFWRIGKGIAQRLERLGIYTMRHIAECDEDILYKEFGVDAELMIDHAWGREPVTMADIKAYKPSTNCISMGQVLMRDYTVEEGRTIVKEMAIQSCLDLTAKHIVTHSVTIYVGYAKGSAFGGEKGTVRFEEPISADSVIVPAVVRLYDYIMKPGEMIRRIYVNCNNTVPAPEHRYIQTSLFDTPLALKPEVQERDEDIQEAVVSIKKRFGANAILRGMDLKEEATAMERNDQIGGHKK